MSFGHSSATIVDNASLYLFLFYPTLLMIGRCICLRKADSHSAYNDMIVVCFPPWDQKYLRQVCWVMSVKTRCLRRVAQHCVTALTACSIILIIIPKRCCSTLAICSASEKLLNTGVAATQARSWLPIELFLYWDTFYQRCLARVCCQILVGRKLLALTLVRILLDYYWTAKS